MTDDPTPLDPDQVACPRCGAGVAVPCHTPTGAKARTIHVERRRLAAAGGTKQTQPPANPGPTRRGKSPATPEGRSKGGRKSAQDRRRRRAEQEAAVEAAQEEALREEAQRNAVRLAEDAVRFANDRAILRRQTLDAATRAAGRLLEALDGLQVVKLDEDGRPLTTPIERTDRDGRIRTIHVPDVRGAYSADTVERLAKVAASTLNSLRLEEGKPTGIQRNEDAGVTLDQASVDELLSWASANLPKGQ